MQQNSGLKLSARLCLIHSLVGVLGSLWPVPYQLDDDTLPNLEIGLASSGSSVLAELDHREEHALEEIGSSQMEKLRSVLKEVLQTAEQRAQRVANHAMRSCTGRFVVKTASNTTSRPVIHIPFLATARSIPAAIDRLSVDVHVVPADNSVNLSEAELLVRQESESLSSLFEQATSDLHGLSDIIMDVFEDEVRGWTVMPTRGNQSDAFRTSTLAALAHSELAPHRTRGEATVHVVSNAPFPTSAVSIDMLVSRAAVRQRLVQRKILQLGLQMMKAEHRIIERALSAAVVSCQGAGKQ